MHWKGGILGTIGAIFGWAVANVGPLSQLAGHNAAVVSGIITVVGAVVAAQSVPVGTPKVDTPTGN